MTDIELLEDRLDALERTVVDGEFELDGVADAEAGGDVEQFEERLDELEERIASLEASIESIEGYVSNVEGVNEEVEQQANTAIAAVDRLEERIETLDVPDLDTEELQRKLEAAKTTPADDPSGTTGPFDEVAVDEWSGEGPVGQVGEEPDAAWGNEASEPTTGGTDEGAEDEAVDTEPQPEPTPDPVEEQPDPSPASDHVGTESEPESSPGQSSQSEPGPAPTPNQPPPDHVDARSEPEPEPTPDQSRPDHARQEPTPQSNESPPAHVDARPDPDPTQDRSQGGRVDRETETGLGTAGRHTRTRDRSGGSTGPDQSPDRNGPGTRDSHRPSRNGGRATDGRSTRDSRRRSVEQPTDLDTDTNTLDGEYSSSITGKSYSQSAEEINDS